MATQAGIILPVWNVERTIREVLEILRCSPEMSRVSEIVIIDNQSTDSTLSIIQDFLQQNTEFASKITVLRHTINYGYGNSIKTGFEYYLAKSTDYVLIMHGDLQESPDRILKNLFAEYDQNPNIDFILTSRFTAQSSTRGYSLARSF